MKRIWLLLILLAALPLHAESAQPLEAGTQDEVISTIDGMAAKKSKDKTTVNYLINKLESPDTDVRVKERAAWALGQIKAEAAIPALMKGAEHKGLLIRSAALNSLVRLRAQAALPNYLEIAKSDPVLILRQRATLALGLIKSEKAIQDLVKLSSDEREEVRGAAALAMSALHSQKNDFSEVFTDMEKDPSPYVQDRAKYAATLAKGPSAQVRELVSSEDADVRTFAALHFAAKGKESDLKILKAAANSESDDDVRDELQAAVKAIQKRAAAKPKTSPAKKPGTASHHPAGKKP